MIYTVCTVYICFILYIYYNFIKLYSNECVWKTEWDSIGICKYYYFDIGSLKHQQRADRRACIASMLIEQWAQSCFDVNDDGTSKYNDDVSEEDTMSYKMKVATFTWWKQIFTVSDDWTLNDCPCE